MSPYPSSDRKPPAKGQKAQPKASPKPPPKTSKKQLKAPPPSNEPDSNPPDSTPLETPPIVELELFQPSHQSPGVGGTCAVTASPNIVSVASARPQKTASSPYAKYKARTKKTDPTTQAILNMPSSKLGRKAPNLVHSKGVSGNFVLMWVVHGYHGQTVENYPAYIKNAVQALRSDSQKEETKINFLSHMRDPLDVLSPKLFKANSGSIEFLKLTMFIHFDPDETQNTERNRRHLVRRLVAFVNACDSSSNYPHPSAEGLDQTLNNSPWQEHLGDFIPAPDVIEMTRSLFQVYEAATDNTILEDHQLMNALFGSEHKAEVREAMKSKYDSRLIQSMLEKDQPILKDYMSEDSEDEN